MEEPGREVVADENVGPLGIVFAAMPPGYPDVKAVKEGTWAEQVGIAAGWSVFEVNGEDLLEMPREVFMQHLKTRPVKLYLEPPTPPESESDGSSFAGSQRSSFQRGSLSRGSRASHQRGSRTSVLRAAAERRRSGVNPELLAQLKVEESEFEYEKAEAKRLRSEVEQEMSLAQNTDIADMYDELVGHLRNKKNEYDRVNNKLEKIRRMEQDQVLDLGVELEMQKKQASLQQRRAEEASHEDADALAEAKELASLLAQVKREEDSAELDKKRWQRLRRGSQFSLGMDIELKQEARVQDLEQAINEEKNVIRDPTTFHIAAEQEEIKRLKKRLDIQEYRLKQITRSHRFDVATAQSEVSEEQDRIRKLEKMELKRLRKAEWENAQYTIKYTDPLCEEVSALRNALPHEEKLESQMKANLTNLESVQKWVARGGAHQELTVLRAAKAHAAVTVARLEGQVEEYAEWMLQDEEHLSEMQSYLRAGKQGPLKIAVRRENEQVRQLLVGNAKASGLLRTREVSARQEWDELTNLKAAYTEESCQYLQTRQQYLVSESARGKWNSELNSIRPKLTSSETIVGRLRAEVYHHEQVQTEAQAMTLDGPLGRAEVAAFEQTFEEEQTVAEAQVRARNAGRIADHAEMSALRSTLKHEEAEVYKITNEFSTGRAATEITTLRNALARERQATSVTGTAYKEMWSEAQEGMAQTREVAELRAKLMQQESVIGRLQQRLDDGMNPRQAEPQLRSFGQFPRERAEIARLREILSREQAMVSQIRVKIAELEVQSTDATQVMMLKNKLATAQGEYGALQKRLLDRTKKGSPELAALRSALIVEQTELRMLRERAPPETSLFSVDPYAAEAMQLRGKLTSEELEVQMLHQRLASRMASSSDAAFGQQDDIRDASLMRTLQVELAEERAIAEAVERQLISAPSHHGLDTSGSFAAAEISVLKTELANAESVAGPQRVHGGFDDRAGLDYMINPHARYDAVLSGSQLSQMARQVEGAELSRLEDTVYRCEDATDKERADRRQVMREVRSEQMSLELEEEALEDLRRRCGAAASQSRLVNSANDADLAGIKVAVFKKEAELEQLEVRLAAAATASHSQPGRQFEVVAPTGTKSIGMTTSLPPDVRVEFCTPGGWAESQGIEAGDELISLNGQPIDYLSKAQFGKMMRERPLQMQIKRSTVQAAFALEKVQRKHEDERLHLHGEIHSLESELRQLESDRDLIKVRFGVAESAIAAQGETARAGYKGELQHMRNSFRNEEDAMASKTEDELFGVAEKSKQATLAEEEATIQELALDNDLLAERNTEEFRELGEMRAALLHEKREAGQLHSELLRCRQDRDQAELKASTSQSSRFEHMSTMRKSLLAVQVAQQEMEDAAHNSKQAIALEAQEATTLRPKYMEAVETVYKLQDIVAHWQTRAESAEAVRTIRAAEVDALKSKLSTEKVESSFGRHEVLEVDALRAARSREVATEHRLQRALAGAEARVEALQIEQHAELSSLKAAVRHAEQIDNRISDNMGLQVVQLANLEAELHTHSEAAATARSRHALADLRNREAESSLLEFETREESVISRKMLGGAARTDARVLSAEAGTRTIEEQAAEWCAEAAMDAEELALTFPHRGMKQGNRKQQVQMLRKEMHLQKKLSGVESEMQQHKRRAQSHGILAEETAEMRLELTEETRAANSANQQIIKARNAEARVLQNALQEVRDATSKSAVVLRQRDALLSEEAEYRREAESQDDMLQDIREMMVQRAAIENRPPPPPSTSWNAASLDSMLDAAHGMLDAGDPAPAAVDALMALSSARPGGGASPVARDIQGLSPRQARSPRPGLSPRPGPGTPGRSPGLGAAGGISSQPSRDGLNTHASQLRVQAEGLRQDMARFQAARQGRRSYR